VTLLAQLVVAQVVLFPAEGRDSNTWCIHTLGSVQHGIEYRGLGDIVSNLPEGKAKRMGYKERTGWFDHCSDFSYLGDGERA
jgi:hypothetical protein